AVLGDPQVAAQRIEHAHAVAAPARRLDQSPGRVQPGVARKDRELHVGNGAGEGNRTLVSSLGSYSSTIELRPRRMGILADQKRLPTVTNTVASLPSAWPKVALAPTSASSPSTRVRAPITKVP